MGEDTLKTPISQWGKTHCCPSVESPTTLDISGAISTLRAQRASLPKKAPQGGGSERSERRGRSPLCVPLPFLCPAIRGFLGELPLNPRAGVGASTILPVSGGNSRSTKGIDISSTFGHLYSMKGRAREPRKGAAMANQPHYVAETQALRRVASNPDCRFIWTKHALEEMEKDGRTAPDVEFALTNGQVVLQEQKRDLLWRVRCRDVDGNGFEVVVAVNEREITIKIVTTF